jgi:hypothetical protein
MNDYSVAHQQGAKGFPEDTRALDPNMSALVLLEPFHDMHVSSTIVHEFLAKGFFLPSFNNRSHKWTLVNVDSTGFISLSSHHYHACATDKGILHSFVAEQFGLRTHGASMVCIETGYIPNFYVVREVQK